MYLFLKLKKDGEQGSNIHLKFNVQQKKKKWELHVSPESLHQNDLQIWPGISNCGVHRPQREHSTIILLN